MDSNLSTSSSSVKSILLAEDNLEHCYFFKKALKDLDPSIQFNEVHDGDALIRLLSSYSPDLLFLDLNMPCKDGIQCIKELRENKNYDNLPVIVFTATSDEKSIQIAYGLGASLYFVKPQAYSKLVNSLNIILQLDWSRPRQITQQYFQGNRYSEFNPGS